MPTIDLHNKFAAISMDHISLPVIENRTTQKEIHYVLKITRLILYPIKFKKGLQVLKVAFNIGVSVKSLAAVLKREFQKSTDFEKMELMAELTHARERIEVELDRLMQAQLSKKGTVVLGQRSVKLIQKNIKELRRMETHYHRLTYPDTPNHQSKEFRDLLKKAYEGFELED